MKLLTKALTAKLIENFKTNQKTIAVDGSTKDFKPVVKFFGGGAATWLITELDPDTNIMFGLCDLGHGFPEMGDVSLNELKSVRFPPFGLGIERDMHWSANKTLSQYADAARKAGRIVSY